MPSDIPPAPAMHCCLFTTFKNHGRKGRQKRTGMQRQAIRKTSSDNCNGEIQRTNFAEHFTFTIYKLSSDPVDTQYRLLWFQQTRCTLFRHSGWLLISIWWARWIKLTRQTRAPQHFLKKHEIHAWGASLSRCLRNQCLLFLKIVHQSSVSVDSLHLVSACSLT